MQDEAKHGGYCISPHEVSGGVLGLEGLTSTTFQKTMFMTETLRVDDFFSPLYIYRYIRVDDVASFQVLE